MKACGPRKQDGQQSSQASDLLSLINRSLVVEIERLFLIKFDDSINTLWSGVDDAEENDETKSWLEIIVSFRKIEHSFLEAENKAV